MFTACNGQGTLPGTDCKMDHFDKEPFFGGPRHPQYVYVPHNESKPYWDIAHEFVLADHMFQSQLDESFVAHQYIIAAQAASAVNIPRAQWGCSGGELDQVQMLTRDSPFGTAAAGLLQLRDARRRARQSRALRGAFTPASTPTAWPDIGRGTRPSSISSTGPIGSATSSRRKSAF